MARILDVSLATPTKRQPFGADANQWMQTAYNEQTAASVIAWIGDSYNPSTVYLLYGGVLTSLAGTTSITAGMVFTNSSFLTLLASSYPDPSGGNTNVVNYQVTYGDGTGTVFSDSSTANVQKNTQLICADGAPGSGTACNYVDLVVASPFLSTGIVYGSVGGYTAANLGSPYFNVGYKVTGNEVVLSGVVAVSIPAPGTFTLFTLPAVARPLSTAVLNPKYTITGVTGVFTVAATGVISYSVSGATSGNIYLDGLSFRIH